MESGNKYHKDDVTCQHCCCCLFCHGNKDVVVKETYNIHGYHNLLSSPTNTRKRFCFVFSVFFEETPENSGIISFVFFVLCFFVFVCYFFFVFLLFLLVCLCWFVCVVCLCGLFVLVCLCGWFVLVCSWVRWLSLYQRMTFTSTRMCQKY